MITEEKLNKYAEYLEQQDSLQKQMQELLDAVPVPQEIVDQWNTIKAEFQPLIDAANQTANELKQDITGDVLKFGQTVRGNQYMAVWNKGRTSWDNKKLEGYAMDHPEILQAQSIGEPTVSFRKVK